MSVGNGETRRPRVIRVLRVLCRGEKSFPFRMLHREETALPPLVGIVIGRPNEHCDEARFENHVVSVNTPGWLRSWRDAPNQLHAVGFPALASTGMPARNQPKHRRTSRKNFDGAGTDTSLNEFYRHGAVNRAAILFQEIHDEQHNRQTQRDGGSGGRSGQAGGRKSRRQSQA